MSAGTRVSADLDLSEVSAVCFRRHNLCLNQPLSNETFYIIDALRNLAADSESFRQFIIPNDW